MDLLASSDLPHGADSSDANDPQYDATATSPTVYTSHIETKNSASVVSHNSETLVCSSPTTPRARHDEPEWGFVWLDECIVDVLIVGDPSDVVPLNQWIDVIVRYQDVNETLVVPSNSVEDQHLHHLSLQWIPISNQFPTLECLIDERVPFFHGYVRQATKADGKQALSPGSGASDSLLLLGLFRSLHPLAKIHTLRICLRHSVEEPCGRFRAVLLATVAFPNLTNDNSKISNMPGPSTVQCPQRRSLLPPRSSSERGRRHLSPALQLLLSIIRSDWDFFDHVVEKMRRPPPSDQVTEQDGGDASRIRTRPSFFPPRLTLNEIYQSTPELSTTRLLAKEHRSAYRPTPTTNARLESTSDLVPRHGPGLLEIPPELWTQRLGPLLRAPELEALRSTCQQLHHELRAVVPGLKLVLYRHQVESLAWMRTRENRQIWEVDCLPTSPQVCIGTDSDIHRAVTGGATVRLQSRSRSTETPSATVISSSTVRLDQCTGMEVLDVDYQSAPRKVARGGLLCDDPGLGKTITVLALILQTNGVMTNKMAAMSQGKDNMPQEIAEDAVFEAYWKENIAVEFRKQALLKIVNKFYRCVPARHSLPVKNIRTQIENRRYDDSFSLFEADMRQIIRQDHISGPDRNNVVIQLEQDFDALVTEYKATQLKSTRRTKSDTTIKPKSVFAALFTQRSQHQLVQSLLNSSGTLIVIPHVLMDHWQTQICLHIDSHYVSNKMPYIFEYHGMQEDDLEEFNNRCLFNRTHFPFVFLDRAGTRDLPPADLLAKFQIVLTTTDRFKNEWKNGSFESELASAVSDQYDVSSNCFYGDSVKSCSLLKVHWLRMIVDEGHVMGKNNVNSAIQFASWISAERRWAMTGTPTQQGSMQLRQLNGLIRFLNHGFFTRHSGGEMAWSNCIAASWRDGHLSAFFRLRLLLALLMKRHTKLDVVELPAPHILTTVLPMSSEEVETYNTLVCGVQVNLVATAMEGATSGKEDSLIHRSNLMYAREALSNIRRVCIGYSRVIPTVPIPLYIAFRKMLHSLHHNESTIQKLARYVQQVESEKLTECEFCAIHVPILLVFPCCGALVCTECINANSRSCLICEREFDVDALQKLQPGFEMVWKVNSKTKVSTSLNRSVVATSRRVFGGESAYEELVMLPPLERRRIGDGHICEYYASTPSDGRCLHCFVEHDCNLREGRHTGDGLPCCSVCHREAQTCPSEESKAFYLIKKLEAFLNDAASRARSRCNDRPLKVLVFSQFRQSLDHVGHRLIRRFGAACIAEYWGKYRSQELNKFLTSDAFCMLLGKDGSEGLDLSLVTHIFFIEAIWDKSLEEQAIARAWRMGARGRVTVETLVSENSVEETMQQLERPTYFHDGIAFDHEETRTLDQPVDEAKIDSTLRGDEYFRQKTHYLLRSLRLITSFQQFGLPGQQGDNSKDGLPKKRMSNSTPSQDPRPKRIRFLE